MKIQTNEFNGQVRNASINLRLLLRLLSELIGGLASGDEYEVQDAYCDLCMLADDGFFRSAGPSELSYVIHMAAIEALLNSARGEMPWLESDVTFDILRIVKYTESMSIDLKKIESQFPDWKGSLSKTGQKLLRAVQDGKPKSFNSLVATVWDGRPVENGSVDKAIRRLNAKLSEHGFEISIRNSQAQLKRFTRVRDK